MPLDFPAYLNILKNKTAVLMSASCLSGAVLAGADPAAAQRLGDFGMAFGLAFQLLDDHKDHDSLVGKQIDIVEKALQQMARAREILDRLKASVYREELIRACDFVVEAVKVTAP